MKIIQIENDGTGAEMGLQIGDRILRINGRPVRDVLDYRFLIAEEDVEMEVLRGDENVIYEIEKDMDDLLGVELEDLKIRHCGNDCPFCFVDQNPKGMRSAMYFRDEDFRLSFLSGHYVTLTNLSKADMERIVWQRLSPLFVSVHATEPSVRKFLFGIQHDDGLMEKLEFLTDNGIELHTQIVLCPEINDGAVLKKTIWDLAKFLPNLKSVSIVPVGLTKHRDELFKFKPVTNEYAARLLDTADGYAAEFYKQIGEYFVYSSDEFYIMAGISLPTAERYDGFYQRENGVGMVRFMLDDFELQRERFPHQLSRPRSASFVTATLASRVMADEILPALNRVKNFEARLEVVENNFYGDSIRITGLLTGQDIFDHLSKCNLGDVIFLPGNCLKDDRIFLDDWTIDGLGEKLQRPVFALDNDFCRVFELTEISGGGV
jgi:putative radical SAM enzyme (TIGR03279 family)